MLFRKNLFCSALILPTLITTTSLTAANAYPEKIAQGRSSALLLQNKGQPTASVSGPGVSQLEIDNAFLHQLNDINHLAHQIKKNLSGVKRETERKLEGEIDPAILDSSMMDDPVMTAVNKELGGMQPARQEWLDSYNYQIKSMSKLLTKSIKNLKIAGETGGDIDFYIKEMNKLIDHYNANLPRYYTLCEGLTCEGDQIGMATVALYDDLKGIQDSNKKIAKTIKTQVKKEKKAEKER